MSDTSVLDRPTSPEPGPDPGAQSHDGVPATGHGAPPPRRLHDWFFRAATPEAIVTLAVVAVCVVFTFVELQPSKVFANTTPAGGDMGAHVWLPAFLKSHLIGHLRVTGWTPDWYDGFPALTYYFPLPMWAIALASYILPYNIAFKLVVISGLVTLPICAWAFGRLARMPFPVPACLAVGSVGFLFCRDFTIYGGNIASTMAGEFSFSISMSFALLFLGFTARGLRTGRHRALAAVLLALCALSHILPMFFAIGGAVVLTAIRPTFRRWVQWTVPVLVVGGALTAFWALPFVYRLPYATNMGYQKLTTYMTSLFPPHDIWLFILAAAGILLSFVRRERIGVALGILLVGAGVVFRFAPQARLWNARVLPFWFLLLYLLAGVALAEVGRLIAEAATKDVRTAASALLPVPVVALIIGLLWVAFPLRILPLGTINSVTGKYSWLGITSADSSFVPDWVRWNFSGYQSPGKARRQEYFALIKTMSDLGKNPADGCGRADWEYEPELDQMGTPDALMLLPYWTNGCIGSQEGLYYESSATTPYHFLNESQLSVHPADPERGLDYTATTSTVDGQSEPNVAAGVAHLQMLGVKYYMALNPQTQSQADADPALTQVASVGPYPVTYTNSTSAGGSGSGTQVVQRTWKIYRVADSQMVTALSEQPVVVKGVSQGGTAWLNNSQSWYLNPNLASVYEAASGPKSWTRVTTAAVTGPNPSLPEQPLPPVTVSNITSNDDSVSFNVDRTGVPVLVRMSYFPNWKVSGAEGVYRVTPNLMVVIPTSTHVRLHYGYTPIDWLGFILSLLGVAAVVALVKMRPARLRRPSGAWSVAPAPIGTATLEPATAGAVTDHYAQLGTELSRVVAPSQPGTTQDHDMWLGHPGGLDTARYFASEWQGAPMPVIPPDQAPAGAPEDATPEDATPDSATQADSPVQHDAVQHDAVQHDAVEAADPAAQHADDHTDPVEGGDGHPGPV